MCSVHAMSSLYDNHGEVVLSKNTERPQPETLSREETAEQFEFGDWTMEADQNAGRHG